jgi:hypothetical protein
MSKQPTTGVPAGFQQVATGQFPPNHDFKENPVCSGVIQQIKESDQKRGKKTEKVKILYVADESTGEITAVWESAALADFMTQVKPGDSVYIKFEGVAKLKGKKTLKKFTCAYKSKGGKK